MTRNELTDMILDTKKMLHFYEGITPNCISCVTFNKGLCAIHGQVPDEFVEQGCDEWSFDDVPF